MILYNAPKKLFVVKVKKCQCFYVGFVNPSVPGVH